MKILHVVPTYLPAWRYGGPIRSVHGLCKALVNLGHEVHVYTTNINGNQLLNVPLALPIKVDGVWVTYFPVFKPLRRIYYSPLMKKKLQKNISSFDFVHLHSIFLWPTYMAAKIAFLAAKPYAISPRGMLVKDLFKRKNFIIKNIWLLFFERINLVRASFIHVTTALEKHEVLKFRIPIKAYVLSPNGVDDFESEPIDKGLVGKNPRNLNFDNPKSFSPYILFVGRLSWKKGIDRLIQAFSFVDQNINLVIAGNDEENYSAYLYSIAVKYKLQDRVFFIGEIRGKQKSNFYKFAKILVLPSYSENFGNVLLEALYMGCPVAATKDVGLHDELVTNGVAISLPDEIEAMGTCLRESMVDNILLKKIGEKGRSLVLKKYSWGELAVKVELAYSNYMHVDQS